MTQSLDRYDYESILRFYAESGVDNALLDDASDRFAEMAAASTKQSSARQSPAFSTQVQAQPLRADAGNASLPDETQVQKAREIASGAQTLDALRDALSAFDGCNLKTTAKNLVFADGNPHAPLMVIGDAPGRDEDLEGLPFAGASGRLLDAILKAIGLDRESVYIANVIPWRPPGNRTPTTQETEICRPFIERQIELADPKLIVTLGAPPSKIIAGANEGIVRLRGNWQVHRTASGKEIPVMPTLLPTYLLRNPAHKKLAWKDFLAVKLKLRELSGN